MPLSNSGFGLNGDSSVLLLYVTMQNQFICDFYFIIHILLFKALLPSVIVINLPLSWKLKFLKSKAMSHSPQNIA